MATDMSPEALRLKQEGNTLFTQKRYAQAAQKYTEALMLDPQNSVFYSNRSACYSHMGKADEALDDVQNAVFIDPGYTKAWVRLASLNEERKDWEQAITAWEEAVRSLTHPGRYPKAVGGRSTPGTHTDLHLIPPATKLTAAEVELKKGYEERCFQAKERLAARQRKEQEKRRKETKVAATTLMKYPEGWGEPVKFTGKGRPKYEGDEVMPWERAMHILATRSSSLPPSSSAWAIGLAGKEFIGASEDMITQANAPVPIHIDVCIRLVNGLLRDRRVVHLYKDSRWLDCYNRQVTFELNYYNGWPDSGPNVVIREARKRLNDTKDWEAVRKALGTTVGAWIINAHLAGYHDEDWGTAVQWYGNAVGLIKAVRQNWRQLKSHEGDNYRWRFFGDSYYLSVRALYMDAMYQANTMLPRGDSIYPISELLSVAKELTSHVEAWRPYDESAFPDPGFTLSHYAYTHAESLAVQGYCYSRMAEKLGKDECSGMALLSFKNYIQAAAFYDVDDERHCLYIFHGVSAACASGGFMSTLAVILTPVREFVRKLSHGLYIWEHSSLFTNGTPQFMCEKYGEFIKWANFIEAEYVNAQLRDTDVIIPAFVKKYPSVERWCEEREFKTITVDNW